jgi:uncharacterized protein (DUF1684 family)
MSQAEDQIHDKTHDQTDQEAYRQQIERWRKEREAALRLPEGWLSLAGLFILKEREYSLGSGVDNQIVLPESAPAHLGVLHYQAQKAHLDVTSDAPVLVNGAPMRSVEMVDNHNGRQPTVVKVGTVSMNLHKFGDEIALRVKDSASAAVQEFAGCRWYEVKPEYHVQGHLTRQPAPAAIPVITSVKTEAHYQSVGVVVFELLGQRLQLLAAATSNPNELFIIFRDATAGRETYGAGRYLYAAVDETGRVNLDFNKAYNPPCAFTPYATCSWPPAENVLAVAIEAGELY